MRSLTARFSWTPEPANLNPAKPEPKDVQLLRPRIEIPLCDPAPGQETADALLARGRFLARQEDWETLSAELRAADAPDALTEDLRPRAALLAQGARADAVEAGRRAIAKSDIHMPRTVTAALEAALEDLPDCPYMAYILVATHIDLAQSWTGASHFSDLSRPRRDGWEWHMQAAARLVERFNPFELGSPVWAKARCQILAADSAPLRRIADDYEDLIDLQPGCPDHMRAFGRDLLPQRFGNREVLDREARRTATRTRDIWGMGGYAWVYMGALEQEPSALRALDDELFVEGLHDILRHCPDQPMVNRLAAFTGLTLPASPPKRSKTARVSDCFNWIVQDHLRELHPTIWAQAPTLLPAVPLQDESADLVKRGRMRANSTIAERFAPLLANGRRLVFTPDGLKMPRMT